MQSYKGQTPLSFIPTLPNIHYEGTFNLAVCFLSFSNLDDDLCYIPVHDMRLCAALSPIAQLHMVIFDILNVPYWTA